MCIYVRKTLVSEYYSSYCMQRSVDHFFKVDGGGACELLHLSDISSGKFSPPIIVCVRMIHITFILHQGGRRGGTRERERYRREDTYYIVYKFNFNE